MPDRALRRIAWFWLFVVLVLSPPRRTVLVLVIDGLNRLASNAIFKARENIRRRDIYRIGLKGAFRVSVQRPIRFLGAVGLANARWWILQKIRLLPSPLTPHTSHLTPHVRSIQPLGPPSPPGLWPGEQGAGGLRGPSARKAAWL
jgi:hypothetical protein